jgi:hypothetical protein
LLNKRIKDKQGQDKQGQDKQYVDLCRRTAKICYKSDCHERQDILKPTIYILKESHIETFSFNVHHKFKLPSSSVLPVKGATKMWTVTDVAHAPQSVADSSP